MSSLRSLPNLVIVLVPAAKSSTLPQTSNPQDTAKLVDAVLFGKNLKPTRRPDSAGGMVGQMGGHMGPQGMGPGPGQGPPQGGHGPQGD